MGGVWGLLQWERLPGGAAACALGCYGPPCHMMERWPAASRPPVRYTLPDLPAALAAGPRAVRAAAPHALLAGAGTPGGCWTYELPRINKAAAMRPGYRYVYCAAAASRDSRFFDVVAKARGAGRGGRLERSAWHACAGTPAATTCNLSARRTAATCTCAPLPNCSWT